MLESAVPPHLRKERLCPVSTPKDYQPPFPAYCARFTPQTKDLVLVVVGVQHASPSDYNDGAIFTIKMFMTGARDAIRPYSWDVCSMTDKRGAFNIAVFAYWKSADEHKMWEAESGIKAWWDSPDREHDGYGLFKEVFRPSIDRFETVFSSNENPEGAANMQDHISGEIEEHVYWGSMRDRMPASQDDPLDGEKNSTAGERNSGSMKRIRIPGKQNLCIIRSGQDWSDTLPAERDLYLKTMHPVLETGMNFLRDQGREIGCYANNLWAVMDPVTNEGGKERTFGFGFFRDMKALEYWSKSHPTHVDIFGGFLQYARKLDGVLSLRLFHEVYVLEKTQQEFEYIGCHAETGLLGSLRF